MSEWKEVTTEWQREEGEERHVKYYGNGAMVSVLHRLTGFGYWEWETGILFFPAGRRYKADESRLYIVRGDRRKELDGLRACQLMPWYRKHQHERNSFETLISMAREGGKS